MTYMETINTYWACGIILIVAGIYLFVGMGINYRLEAKEQKAGEKQKTESKEMEPKEVIKAAQSPRTERHRRRTQRGRNLRLKSGRNRSFGAKIHEKCY